MTTVIKHYHFSTAHGGVGTRIVYRRMYGNMMSASFGEKMSAIEAVALIDFYNRQIAYSKTP